MLENVREISTDRLLSEVQDMRYNGYRFVTITCVNNKDGSVDLFYHFDKGLKLENLKITVTRDEEIASISRIYFCAVIVENEIKELFGLNITNIIIDYNGKLFLTEESEGSPMGMPQITIERRDSNE